MKVWNKRDAGAPKDAVYVGRPTKYGNPFTHLSGDTRATWKVSTREEAVEKYRGWLLTQPELVKAARKELRGKDLVCWCAPAACHADVLMEIANDDLGGD